MFSLYVIGKSRLIVRKVSRDSQETSLSLERLLLEREYYSGYKQVILTWALITSSEGA